MAAGSLGSAEVERPASTTPAAIRVAPAAAMVSLRLGLVGSRHSYVAVGRKASMGAARAAERAGITAPRIAPATPATAATTAGPSWRDTSVGTSTGEVPA